MSLSLTQTQGAIGIYHMAGVGKIMVYKNHNRNIKVVFKLDPSVKIFRDDVVREYLSKEFNEAPEDFDTWTMDIDYSGMPDPRKSQKT